MIRLAEVRPDAILPIFVFTQSNSHILPISNCIVWDVEHAKQIESFESDGFVQCVQFCPTSMM